MRDGGLLTMLKAFLLIPFALVLMTVKERAPFKVEIKDTNYTPNQKLKLHLAGESIEKVFNSPEFRSSFLSTRFTSNKGMSNEDILETLLKAAERPGGVENGTMDLMVTMYSNRFSRVVGYTTFDSPFVFTNSKFHNDYNSCQIAGNLSHEWSHKMGFTHESAAESSSIPYALGELVFRLCEKSTN